MIAIAFRFLAGRYHATPWGRHVNEGAVEWPPSPWRVLRALVATWKRTASDLTQVEVEPILRALAPPPAYRLPPASTGHTRHFMPWFKKGPDDRTLVFDAFVALPKQARLIAHWPDAELDEPQRARLVRILTNLNTLGRSESWCEACLIADLPGDPALPCRPITTGGVQPHEETVRLLCPDGNRAFSDDHVLQVQRRTTGRGKSRQTVEERSSSYEPAWNLCIETLQLHAERWSDPPASRWVAYARPRECFRVEPTRARPIPPRAQPQVVRYALDSTVLPLVTETLPVAEAVRRALLWLHAEVRGRDQYGRGWSRSRHREGLQPLPASRVFAGKDEAGHPLHGHGHAYYLPTDEDQDGRLDHLTVCTAEGFTEHEVRAFDRLREFRSDRRAEERHPVQLLLLGMGTIDAFHPGPLLPSRRWVSATPYVAVHFAKSRGRQRIDLASPRARAEFLMADLRAQLAAVRPDLGTASPRIEPLWDDHEVFRIDERWRPIQFKRYRRKRSDDGGRRLAGAFRIEFSMPVKGPLALGHSSHFGLGLFRPDGVDSEKES